MRNKWIPIAFPGTGVGCRERDNDRVGSSVGFAGVGLSVLGCGAFLVTSFLKRKLTPDYS